MTARRVRVVARVLTSNFYGHNIVLAALGHERPGDVESMELVRVATSEAEAATEIATALHEVDLVLVTWSFYSADLASVAAEVTRLRDAWPDPRVTHVAGGVHASAEPESTLHAGFDLCVIGEGESVLVALVDALQSGTPVADVPGLAALDGNGAYVAPAASAPRHELDRYPAFAAPWRRYNPIELTRGCIYACRFCQTPYLFKARFRHRSIDNVVEHVRHMRANGFRYVRFITPTALSYGTQDTEPDLDAVGRLLSSVRAAIGPGGRVYFGSFPSELRPEHVTPGALALLRRYVDNTNVIIGAQSGDDGVLAGAKRGHTVADVERAVAWCVEAGFTPNVDFLFGLPGEGPAEATASVAFAERLTALGARIHAHTFMPLPGTPWRDRPAGSVDADTERALDRLAARGALYGQWRRQQSLRLVTRPR